jgi:hypothetical protein
MVFPLLWICLCALADEPVFSGPQPGEKLTPFKVLGSTGPDAGKEVELIGRLNGAPTLLIFVHEATRPGHQLMRPLDHYGAKLAKDGFATHFVWLAADKTKAEAYLNAAKNSLNLKAPISISLDGQEGPGNYGLNRKVTLTLLVAKDNKVVANFALIQPNETDAPKVLAAMAKLMGQQAPALDELRAELGAQRPAQPRPAADLAEQVRQLQAEVQRLREMSQRATELQKQVDELTDALNEARAKLAKMEGAQTPNPIRKRPPLAGELPGRSSSNPELVSLMRRLIQPTNDEAAVKEVVEAMTKWAGDDAARRQELAEFCKRIAHLGYGSEHVKKAVKKLAGE